MRVRGRPGQRLLEGVVVLASNSTIGYVTWGGDFGVWLAYASFMTFVGALGAVFLAARGRDAGLYLVVAVAGLCVDMVGILVYGSPWLLTIPVMCLVWLLGIVSWLRRSHSARVGLGIQPGPVVLPQSDSGPAGCPFHDLDREMTECVMCVLEDEMEGQ